MMKQIKQIYMISVRDGETFWENSVWTDFKSAVIRIHELRAAALRLDESVVVDLFFMDVNRSVNLFQNDWQLVDVPFKIED